MFVAPTSLWGMSAAINVSLSTSCFLIRPCKFSGTERINSVHTRCIAKTSHKCVYKGFVKIGDFIKFKGFLVEILERRRS